MLRLRHILPPLLVALLGVCLTTPTAADAAAASAASSAKVLRYTYYVSEKTVAPDGVSKVVPLVNGQLPGPTLEATVGDRVIITVVNNLSTETTSIHWHGVKQLGTPWSDGVPSVTQCPIQPGESYVYDFVLDSPGTLWWHSHTDLQKGSVLGAIVIHGDEPTISAAQPIEDRVLMLNDWYHNSSASETGGLDAVPFRWVGDPQAVLFNGKGQYNCSLTTLPCDPASPDAGPYVLDVEPGRTYRLRIINGASLSFLSFLIDQHPLLVVEADANLIAPFNTSYLDMAQGQSYSVLLRTYTLEEMSRLYPNHTGNFWMEANIRHRSTGPQGLAVLRYMGAGNSLPVGPPPVGTPAWNDTVSSLKFVRQLTARNPVPLPSPSRRFIYLGTQNTLPDGRIVWALNNISYQATSTPLLESVVMNVQSEESSWVEQTTIPTPFDYTKTLSSNNLSTIARRETQVVQVKKDEVIEIVFQNTLSLSGVAEAHPWHLHLHNMWALGYGEPQSTWTEASASSYNTLNPPLRNTVMLYPGSWTAIRFIADNPATAFVHCHIVAHLYLGMGFVLQIGNASQIPCPPAGVRFCGAAANASMMHSMKYCLPNTNQAGSYM